MTSVTPPEPPRFHPFDGLSNGLLRQVHHAIAVASAATGKMVPLGADKQPIRTGGGKLDWRDIRQVVNVALCDDTDWTSWALAVDDHRFVVFDYDHPNPWPMLNALELWEHRGWDWQAVHSGRPGHLQIWVKTEHHSGEDVHALCVEATQLGCDRRHSGALIRSFAAPHPWGLDVASVRDVTAEQIAAWFTPPAQNARSIRPTGQQPQSTWWLDLPHRGFDLSAPHRHGQFFSHLLASYRAGRTADDAWERIEAPSSRIAGYCREKNRSGRRWFDKRWQRAVDTVETRTTTPPPTTSAPETNLTADETAELFAAGLELIDTSTAAGCHMAHLYAHHCTRGRRTFKASCYDPAVAWIGDETAVAAANRGLVTLGLLTTPEERRDRFEATTYQLPELSAIGNPDRSPGRFTPCSQKPRTALATARVLLDTWLSPAFSWGGGLGTTAARVRTLLAATGDELSVRVIAGTLGRNEDSVRAALKKLEDAGLVVYRRGVGATLPAADLHVGAPEPSERKQATVVRRRIRLACCRAVFRRWELTLARVDARNRHRNRRASVASQQCAA